ncbi:IOVO protein, partial [Notiomystis cincta]|nr:IOVO protein [Notiomystis cincta]
MTSQGQGDAYIYWGGRRREPSTDSPATDPHGTAATTTSSSMKMANCSALLGLVLLSCLSDIPGCLSQASCSSYLLSGKTSSIACPRSYDPVCGTNGRTYPNECSLCRDFIRNRFLDKKHDGRCVLVDCTGFLKPGSGYNTPCTMEYSPICGTNGITYRNKCNFCNAVASGLEVNLQSYGQCFQQQTIDCSQQKGSNLFCSSEYNPVCGSDGRTYRNSCQFCNAAQQWKSALQAPGLVLSAGAGLFNVTFPSQILQSNMLLLAPPAVTHQSLL